MNLGDRIAARMKELGLTQTELARRSGLRQHTISQLVNGVRGKGLPYRTVFLLKRELGVGDEFFSDAVSRPRSRSDVSPAKG